MAGFNVLVLGISVDRIPCVKAWAESLKGIHYPLLSDFWPHGAVAERYGVLRPEGTSERAIFIVDKEGIIRYIDIHDIDEQPDNEVLLKELMEILPGAEVQLKPLFKTRENIDSSSLVMYCTPWCPDCRDARAWLKARGIVFEEVDISMDLDAARKVRMLGGGHQITPVFEYNGKTVIDFNIGELEKLLTV